MTKQSPFLELTGDYNLTHKSPDHLPDKRLTIYPDNQFVLLEYEGSTSGATQYFYIGNYELLEGRIQFKIRALKRFENLLVNDDDDSSGPFASPHTEEFEGRVKLETPPLIQFTLRDHHFTYKRTDLKPLQDHAFVEDI